MSDGGHFHENRDVEVYGKYYRNVFAVAFPIIDRKFYLS